jgi:hypothetical protein
MLYNYLWDATAHGVQAMVTASGVIYGFIAATMFIGAASAEEKEPVARLSAWGCRRMGMCPAVLHLVQLPQWNLSQSKIAY